MATEADIQEPTSVLKREEESQYLASGMCDRAVGEFQPEELKEFESDEILPKTEHKQTAIGVGAETENTVSKGNPENSEGESILASPEVLKVSSKETCEISEISEVDDSLLQAGQEVTEDNDQMENVIKFQIEEKAGIGEGEVIKAMEGGVEKIDPKQNNLHLAATNLMTTSFGDSSVNLGENEGLKEEKILNQQAEVIAAKDAPSEEGPEAIDEKDSASIDVSSVDETAPTVEETLDQASSITTRDKQATTESSDKMKSLDEDNKPGDAADKGIIKDDPLVEVKSSISIIDENVGNFQVKSLPEATPVLSGENKDCKGEDAAERNNNITEEEVQDGPEIMCPTEANKEIIKDNAMLPLTKLTEGERFESFKDDENEAGKSKREDDTECVTEDGQKEDLRPESAEEVSGQNFQVDEKEADKFEGEKHEKSDAAAGDSIASEASQIAESPQEMLNTMVMRQEYNLKFEDKSIPTTEALPEEKGNDNEQDETEGPNEKNILEKEDSKILQESDPGEKLEHSLHLTSEETERIPSEADKIPCLMEGVLQNPGETLEDEEEEVTGEADNNRIEENGTTKEDLKLEAETSDASKSKESIISEKETKVGKLEVEAFTKAYNLNSEEKPECGDGSDIEDNTKKEEAEEVHESAKIDDKEEDTGQSIINDEPQIGDGSQESVAEESHESHQEVKTDEKMPELEVLELETTSTSEDAEKHTFEEKEEEISMHQSTLLAAKIEEGSKEENTAQIMTGKEENQATHEGEDIDTQKTEDGSNKTGDNSEVPAIETNIEESLNKENKEKEPEKEVYEAFITADSGTGKEHLSIEETDEDFSSSTKDEIVKEISKVSNSSLALTRDTEETGSVEETTPQTTEDRPEPENDHCTLDSAEEGKEEKIPEEKEEGLIQNSSFESEVSKDTEELLEKERTNITDVDSLSLAAEIEETKVKEAEPEDKTMIGGSDIPFEEKGLAAIETKGIDLDSEDVKAKEDSNSFEKDKEIPTAAYEIQNETSNTEGEHEKEVTTRESPLKENLEGHLKENSEVPLEEHGPTSPEATEINETSEKIQDPHETSEAHSMSDVVEEMVVQKEDNSSNPLAVPVLGTVDMGEESVDEIKKHTDEDQDLHAEQSTETCISRTEDTEVLKGEETREESECEKPIDETVNYIEPSGIRKDGEKDIEEPENSPTNLVGSLKGNTDVEKETTELERSDGSIDEAENVNEEPSQIEEVKDYFPISTENEDGDKTGLIERGSGAVYIPRELSAEDTDKAEKSLTMEDLDETPCSHPEHAKSERSTLETSHAVELGKDILASDAVYKPQDKDTEENAETRKSTIEETEGGLESQYAKQDEFTFDKALPEAKSEEQLQTPSPRLPSQNKEIETTINEKEKEGKHEDKEMLESGCPEDFSDAKTTEEVCLRSGEQREPKVVLEDDITVCQGVPAEKPEEKIQTPSLLPSEEQEYRKTNTVGKTEQDKMQEATIMLDQTTDGHSDANTKEGACFQGPTKLETITGDDVTTGQTITANKSDERTGTTSSVSLSKEQDSETSISIEKTGDEKTGDTGILEVGSPEDSSGTKKTEEICFVQEKPQELEGDRKDVTAATQSLLVEKSKEQIPAPSSTLPSEEPEHGTTTKVDEREEERVNEDKGPIEVEGVAKREVIAGLILPADESEEIRNTKSVEKEAEKIEDDSHEDSSMAVVQHELTDSQTFSAEKTKQQAQEEEQETTIIAKTEDEKEEAEIIEDDSANSNTKKELCLQKDSTEPETVEENKITADQTSIEEKSEEQSQSAISALPSNEQKCDDATKDENTDGRVFSAEESEQKVQEEQHEAVIISKMVVDDKKEEATNIDYESAEDAQDSKTMEDLCQQKEPTGPIVVTEDEITADQAPVEKKAEEHIQIAISALPSSSEQESEGATEVENTDSKTFSLEKSEKLVQQKEHETGIIGEKIEGNKIEGGETIEHENTKDASESNTMTDLSLQKESTEPEAAIEKEITADQTLTEEKSEEQIQNAISALPSKDQEFEGATTVENTDGQTFSAEKSEQQVQEEHEAVIIAKKIEDGKKAEAEIIEGESAGDASDSKTMEDLYPQKESTKSEAVIENEIPVDQTVVEEKSEEEIQIANSSLPPKEEEVEGATTVENIEEDKIKEREILEEVDAKRAEDVLLEKGMLQEFETVVRKEEITSQKKEEKEIKEDESAENAKTMRDLRSQKESTELEAALDSKITIDQTVVEEKPEEQVQIATHALPSEEQERKVAAMVENIEEEKIKEAEILEQDILLQKERLQVPEAVRQDEIESAQALPMERTEQQLTTPSYTLPSEEEEHGTTTTEVNKVEEETMKEEEILEKDSSAGKPEEKEAEDMSLAKERLQKLEGVRKDEGAFGQTPMKKLEEQLQASSSKLLSEEEKHETKDKEKTIEEDEPKKNGDSSEEIKEDKEAAQTMKASNEEDQLKDGFLGAEENNATFKTTTKEIQTEEMSVEIQKVDGNNNVEKILAEDGSLKDTDNTTSVAMTETKTLREEESGVALPQKETSTEKTANEVSDKQIPSGVDVAESTGKPASTGNEIALLEKQDRAAETFKKGEVRLRDLEPGNAKEIYSEIKEFEHGGEKKSSNPDDTAIQEVILANLLEKSTKETPPVAKEMTEEKERTTSKEKPKIEEVEEEEGNKQRKIDSDPDSPIMVEAPREIIVKVPQKKSHNILSGVGSKVKHSISMVKKAFTCASPDVVNPKLSEKTDE